MGSEESKLTQFLRSQLAEHSREVEEILKLQTLLKLLQPSNEGVYIAVEVIANSS
jgi:hypothetical protein